MEGAESVGTLRARVASLEKENSALRLRNKGNEDARKQVSSLQGELQRVQHLCNELCYTMVLQGVDPSVLSSITRSHLLFDPAVRPPHAFLLNWRPRGAKKLNGLGRVFPCRFPRGAAPQRAQRRARRGASPTARTPPPPARRGRSPARPWTCGRFRRQPTSSRRCPRPRARGRRSSGGCTPRRRTPSSRTRSGNGSTRAPRLRRAWAGEQSELRNACKKRPAVPLPALGLAKAKADPLVWCCV